MSTSKPRITVTLEPGAHLTLSRMSAATGQSMSQIVAGFVDLALPSLERVVVLMEKAQAAPGEVRKGLAGAIARAEHQLVLGLSEGSEGGSTPVPVTRGSGHPADGLNGGRDGSV